MPAAVPLQPLQDEIIRLRCGYQPALDLGPARPGERPIRTHRAHQCELVLDPRLEVVGAEGGRYVYQAGTVLGGDEVAQHHHARLPIIRQWDYLERPLVPDPGELSARLLAEIRAIVPPSISYRKRDAETSA